LIKLIFLGLLISLLFGTAVTYGQPEQKPPADNGSGKNMSTSNMSNVTFTEFPELQMCNRELQPDGCPSGTDNTGTTKEPQRMPDGPIQ